MSEPVMDFSDAPDAPTPVTDAPRRRGRPRSPETVERDDRVMAALTGGGPQTKEQLVEQIQLKPSLVYLALWRLKRAGRVERTSDGTTRYVWRVVPE